MVRQIGLVIVLIAVSAAWAEDPAPAPAALAPPAPAIRVVQLPQGLRSIAPERDMQRLPETPEAGQAQKVGLDLLAPNHDILVHRFTGKRLFYIFFTTIEDAYGPRRFVVQRVKKTVRDWKAGAREPEETVTYLVEVFKPFAGMLKRVDRHYGYYALRELSRREIVKEFEIGYAEIPGVAEGMAWPFDAGTLYKSFDGYGPDAALYNQVKFHAVRAWRLAVELARDGRYAIRSRALGFDVPRTMPTRAAGTPAPDPETRAIVLIEGRGVKGVSLGDPPDKIQAALGKPLFVARYASGREAHRTPVRLSVKVDKRGSINALYTNSGFAGRTTKGIRLGAQRGQVLEAYGPPAKPAPFRLWRYPGVLFDFDGFDRVRRIVILP